MNNRKKVEKLKILYTTLLIFMLILMVSYTILFKAKYTNLIQEIQHTKDIRDGRTNVAGVYFESVDSRLNKEIHVYGQFLSWERLDYIWYHEKCHYYWYNELTYEEKEAYIHIYDNAEFFVNEYAQTEYQEDFAESCMYYIVSNLQGQSLNLDKERYDFLSKHNSKLLFYYVE